MMTEMETNLEMFRKESLDMLTTHLLKPERCISQSTYIPRVPQCLTPRLNWDPVSRKSVCLPPEPKGGTNSPAGEGVGESQFGNSDDWRKSLALLR
jgi:hypothetical protein